jgi:hypothetical protein
MEPTEPHPTDDNSPAKKGSLRRYSELTLSILLVLTFMFCIGPLMDRSSVMQPITQFIDERGIDANMYFYTEVEEFSEASIHMDNARAYPPRGMGAKVK